MPKPDPKFRRLLSRYARAVEAKSGIEFECHVAEVRTAIREEYDAARTALIAHVESL